MADEIEKARRAAAQAEKGLQKRRAEHDKASTDVATLEADYRSARDTDQEKAERLAGKLSAARENARAADAAVGDADAACDSARRDVAEVVAGMDLTPDREAFQKARDDLGAQAAEILARALREICDEYVTVEKLRRALNHQAAVKAGATVALGRGKTAHAEEALPIAGVLDDVTAGEFAGLLAGPEPDNDVVAAVGDILHPPGSPTLSRVIGHLCHRLIREDDFKLPAHHSRKPQAKEAAFLAHVGAE